MQNNKTILFIHPFMPYPLESGGHQALFNGIKAVSGHYNVLVAYPAVNNEEYHRHEIAFNKALPGITLLPMLRAEYRLSKSQIVYQWVKQRVKNLLGIKPEVCKSEVYESWISCVSPLDAGWGRHLDSIFSQYKIDLVQVEMPWMIGTVFNLPADVKKVFVHHEIAFVRHWLEIGDNPSTTAKAHAEFTKMVEINLLNRYDAVITLSETDRLKLVDVGVTVPVYTSFAVVNAAEYSSTKNISKVLSFVGPEKHSPNYDGILWFLNNCWEQLKSVDESYRLQIIGNWSDVSKKYIQTKFKDVCFLGFVEDLGLAIKGTVMIVPINIGSGIRMKILEAASRGVPVVSTSVGAEGLPVTDGVHCLIKDDPGNFVKAILSLQNDELVTSICDAAYEMVSQNYSLSALEADRLSILQELFHDN